MKGNHPNDIPLSIPGFTYGDLYAPERLADLLQVFDVALQHDDPALFDEFVSYRLHQGEGLTAPQRSALLVRLAPHLGQFVARLFGVEAERGAKMGETQREFAAVFTYRREIVQAVDKLFRVEDQVRWDLPALDRAVQILKRSAFAEIADETDDERALGALASRLLALRQSIQAQENADRPSSAEANGAVTALRERLARHPQAREVFAPALSEPTHAGFVEQLLEALRRWTYQA
ncbi:MAG: pyridine nucleotide-disulfide oxidoreductase, partial [Gammaproteobacteria bacterium]